MTDIGSNPIGHGPTVVLPHMSLGQRFDALIDSITNFMTSVLCRASRGYLCPPDMSVIMYPDETRPAHYRPSYSPPKECCNEKLPGK